jgi:ferredoxin
MIAWSALQDCTGCRACEEACAFHTTTVFWPAASAIQVMEIRRGQTLQFELRVDPDLCDLCSGERSLRCQQACAGGALSRASITELRKAFRYQ